MPTEDDHLPVRVEGLSKYYGEGKSAVKALDRVSLTVRQGEFLAIIGPSGSGKSTLLHLIAGLASPDAGRVLVKGRDLAEMGDRELTIFRRRNVGLVFQAYNLIPTLSAEDNLRLPLLLDGRVSVPPGRVEELIRSLGLSERRRHRPDQLSGGEQQRVAIGRAMVTDPAVILADEATGNLDTANARRLCQLMRGLCVDHGRTILAVTHDPNVAVWAQRVLVLRDGRIVAELRPSDYEDARDLGAHLLDLTAGEQEAPACA